MSAGRGIRCRRLRWENGGEETTVGAMTRYCSERHSNKSGGQVVIPVAGDPNQSANPSRGDPTSTNERERKKRRIKKITSDNGQLNRRCLRRSREMKRFGSRGSRKPGGCFFRVQEAAGKKGLAAAIGNSERKVVLIGR